MFAAKFEYYKVNSVAEALQTLRAHNGAKLMAGGHSLIPLLKLRLARPAALVDISGILDLQGISVDDTTVHIGPLTTHQTIAASEAVARVCPLMAEVAGEIGDPQVRNRGTIGGNVSHADPASDWPTALTALNAQFVIQGTGALHRRVTRTVAAADFFTGALSTSLGEHEILTEIQVPVMNTAQHSAYAKMAHPATFFSVVSAAVVISMSGNRCTQASVVLGGLAPKPVRAASVEEALIGQDLTADNIAAAAAQVSNDLAGEVMGDIYASAEYRRAVAPVEVKHAIYHAAGLAHS
ncbi:MAG: xanthine dehydrogenase family protein subunit M [SAR202 cluster bacterium]|nr:xanthine dehydrogenase family protein subunit M [SAR202 cluster bacterium]